MQHKKTRTFSDLHRESQFVSSDKNKNIIIIIIKLIIIILMVTLDILSYQVFFEIPLKGIPGLQASNLTWNKIP